MTTTPTTAAPDPVRVARKTCAEMWPAETEAYLCGHLDKSPAMETAIKVARATQEAMSAQGGGERRYGPYPVAWMGAGVWAGIPDELPPELYGRQVYVVPVARPAPEVKDATPGWPDPLESPLAQAIRDGKIDDVDIRDLFDKMERELQVLRRTGSYREVKPTPAPAASDELVERLRAGNSHEHTHDPDKEEAAARIEALEATFDQLAKENSRKAARIEADAAEMEQLRKDFETQARVSNGYCNALIAAEARATAAEAERDALREQSSRTDEIALALLKQINPHDLPEGTAQIYFSLRDQIKVHGPAARAALRPAKGGRE